MKQRIKKVLIISDDFDDYFMEATKEMVESDILKLEFVDSFEKVKIKKYDAALIDYGLIDGNYSYGFAKGRKIEKQKSIEVLQALTIKKIPLAWCGGLAEHYNDDAQVLFPKLKFLHNLPSSHTDYQGILFLLNSIFSDAKTKGVVK